jgi:CRP/FNR family cyclic AMP-dependent transcriptional regulator
MESTPPHLHIRGFQALIGTEQWYRLLKEGSRRTYPSMDRLLDQGAPSRLVHVLTEGRVRVVYTDAGGNEVLVAVRGPGDLLGEYAQRDRGEHSASVWTLEACTTSVFAAAAFEGFMQRERLSDALQRYMLGKARQVGERVWRAANLQSEQRLAQLFLEVVNADPSRTEPTVPMSQQLIADSVGVGRRSVTELLSRWRERGLVRTQPSLVTILDLPALARRAHLR